MNPSTATKLRYQEARQKLGYAKSNNYIDWTRLANRTTFIWKFKTLRDSVKWIWESSLRDFAKHRDTPRSDIVVHYVSKAFGIAISDIYDDQRNITVQIPRSVAICALKLSGMTLNEVARQMKRDHTSTRGAFAKHQHLFQGLTDGIENSGNRGPAPDRSAEQGGPPPS